MIRKYISQYPIHQLFFFAVILFLPSQLGKHFWPSWTLVLGRRIDYLSPTLYLTDIFILFSFFFWFSSLHISPVTINRWVKKHTLPIIVTAVLIISNILPAKEKLLAVYGWITWIKLVLLIVYMRNTQPSLRIITLLLTIAGVFSTSIGLIQMNLKHSVNGVFWLFGERSFSLSTANIAKSVLCFPQTHICREILRPYATFPHPNVLGGFLGVVLILIVIVVCFNKTVRTPLHRLLLIGMGICCVGLITTLSRSAWIATIISISIASLKKQWHGVLWLFFSLIVFLAMITTPGNILQTESVVVRKQLTAASIEIIKHYPFWGVGAHNFLIALPSFLPQRSIYFLQPVHSIYFLLLTELGFLGLSLGIIQFLILRRVSQIKLHAFPFSLPILFLLIIGLFDHYPFTLQQGQLLLAVTIGISLLRP